MGGRTYSRLTYKRDNEFFKIEKIIQLRGRRIKCVYIYWYDRRINKCVLVEEIRYDMNGRKLYTKTIKNIGIDIPEPNEIPPMPDIKPHVKESINKNDEYV